MRKGRWGVVVEEGKELNCRPLDDELKDGL